MSNTTISSELFMSLEDGLPALCDANDLALQVQDQNARYIEVSEVFGDEPETLQLAQLDIAREQATTWASLLTIAPESGQVFETLGRLSRTAPEAIDANELEIAEDLISQTASAWELPMALLEQARSAVMDAEEIVITESIELPAILLSLDNDQRQETNGQRKVRMRQELESAITGPARSIIKKIEGVKVLEKGGIKLDRLKQLFRGIKISEDDVRSIVGGQITIDDDYWLKNTDVVRLMLSMGIEDGSARSVITGKQWRGVINDKIDELIGKELRGVERRRVARSKAF